MILNWSHIEKAIQDKNQDSGYLKYILSSIKVKAFEVRETEVFLSLAVPNMIVKEICEREIASDIEKLIKMEHSKILLVEYIIESSQQAFAMVVEDSKVNIASSESSPACQHSNFQFKHKYSLNPRMNFSNLIVNAENDFTQRALKFFAEDSNVENSCAVLFGNSGVGKTHLLHAVGWHFINQKNHAKIKVVSGDEFISDFQTAIFSKSMAEFKNKYRLKTDVLLIDDLQTLEKAKGTQGELFNLLNEFSNSGKKIIITSDKKISDLFGFDERLRSRFLGGLVLNLELPSLKSKEIYFDSKLASLQIPLDHDMKEAVISNLGACYRSIDGALGRLQMLIKINGVVDRDSVLKMFPLQDKKISSQITLDSVIQEIARKHRLFKADIVGPSRKREVFEARKEAIKYIRDHMNLSLKEIGRAFNRDHTSIINALKN